MLDRSRAVAADRALLAGPLGLVLVAAACLAGAVGTVVGVLSGPLWLDETLSVEIARLPLPELHAALRQDGAPPVYSLLLHAWMAAFGTGTVVVRLLTLALLPVALLLAHRLGSRLGGVALGRAAVVALAALPWTMRYAGEARMYLLVVVLVLAGALLLERVRRQPSRGAVVGLGLVAATLLLTHYWALFLLAAVGALHLRGALRGPGGARRVVVALVLGGVLFLPWLPTFLFQAAHTGAPWADPLKLEELYRTPRYWGGGSDAARTVLALLVVPLAVWGAARVRAVRLPAAVALLTLALAYVTVFLGGGAYTGRYTAVVVPLVCLAVGAGALALPGRGSAAVALAALVAVGASTGIPAAAKPRTSAAGVVAAFTADGGAPGSLLAYCPDQLGPPVWRLLPAGVEQVVYPSFGDPRRIDWVDYAQRQEAADPLAFASELLARAGSRPVHVLAATEYRTFEGQCERVLDGLRAERGRPQVLFGNLGTTGQILYRFG